MPMIEVRLETRTGGLVLTAVIPPFNPPPEILTWGNRSFVLKTPGLYVEGMVWTLRDDSNRATA